MIDTPTKAIQDIQLHSIEDAIADIRQGKV